jgi:DNA polymerase-3 subunit beta
MKFEVNKSKLEVAVNKLVRLTQKQLTLPVLSCVYMLLSKDGDLILKSTNLDLGMEIKIKVKATEAGVVAVPGMVLQSTLSSIKEENVSFELSNQNLKVSSSRNSALIKCMPYEDFPSIPRLEEGKSLKISSTDFINGLKSVWYSASVSFVKPELSSVYIYKQDEYLYFVSTDSFRLAEKKVHIKSNLDFPTVLIPYKNVAEIIKIFDDFKGDLEIIFDKNQAAFQNSEIYLVSRLIDGTFPDYKQIIPKAPICTATVLKNDFINALKASNVFSDTLNQVKLRVLNENGTLGVEAKNNDVGEYKDVIKAKNTGEDIELNFNSKYINDCFQSISSESVVLSFAGVGRPLIIQGNSDNSFLYIVMPMNR